MRKLKQKSALLLVILGMIVLNGAALSAQSAELNEEQKPTPEEVRAAKRDKFISNLRAEIRATQKDFQEVTRGVADANSRLAETRARVDTLKDQMDNLDAQIKNTEDMIINVIVQINQKEAQLIELYQEAEIKNAALENQKQMLTEYLQTIYEQESGIADTINNNQNISIAKLLLSDDTVGDQLLQLKYFSILEETGHELFDNLELMLMEVKADQASIQLKKNSLTLLTGELAKRKEELEVQKAAKELLLEQTKGEEKIYAQLLEESVRQQKQVKVELDTLNENLSFIKKKVAELGDAFNPDEFLSLLSPHSAAIYDYINDTRNGEDPVFHWPVSPNKGISAYYQDASYVATFGFAHNAIDIRVPQGTAIRAPAEGIVYKAKDNGYGYSYIILAHSGGYMTVYGHISEFNVREGEKVITGQIIGLTGGMPGTKGAGYITTGPHLHLEIMKGGKYVDPMYYLPINYLPLESLPLKYQTLVKSLKPKVKRATTAEVIEE